LRTPPHHSSASALYNPITISSQDSLFQQHFLFRANVFYRSLIEHHLHEFRVKNGVDFRRVNSASRCVVAHIRRGDRVAHDGKDKNITKYCEAHKNEFDLGCSEMPFAGVTLELVVHRASELLEDQGGEPVRNLFVITDDDAWLHEQREMLKKTHHSQWKVYDMPFDHAKHDAPAGAHQDFVHRHGTVGGVHFLSSLPLAQQCEAFVGHFASGASWMIYKAMCARHKGQQAVCPPMHDLRQDAHHTGRY
jgi:hypothetical protein